MGRFNTRRFSPFNDVLGSLTPYVYLAPTVLMTIVFLIIPTLSVVWYSFHEWAGIGRKTWVGLANYAAFTADEVLQHSIVINLLYVFFFSLLPLVIGLLIAAVGGRVRVPGEKYLRVILLTPQVIAPVALGVLFGWIFSPAFGLLNALFGQLGLTELQLPWLGSRALAPISVGVVGTWIWVGFATIVFVAGVQKIDETLYDAAKVAGAGAFRQFTAITAPALAHEFVVVVVVTLIRAFGSAVFGVVAAITGGSYGTSPISYVAYRVAFVQSRMGYGSAIIVFLMLIMLGLSFAAIHLGRERS